MLLTLRIFRLCRYIINTRNGRVNEKEDELRLMRGLVEKYTSFANGVVKASEKVGSLSQKSPANDGAGVVVYSPLIPSKCLGLI